MPLTRTCSNCKKRYTITNVEERVVGNSERLGVRCPHCQKEDGTVIAASGTGHAIIVK